MQMTESERIQETVRAFTKLSRMQNQYVNKIFAPCGLKGMMYRYILCVRRHPGVSQDFIAEFFSVDKSRVARVVRELELLGYLTRRPDEKDRRHHCLSLTEAGEAIHAQIRDVLKDWALLLAKDISPDAIALTAATVSRMIENATANGSLPGSL